MDEVLEEIRKLRRDLGVDTAKTAYVTIEIRWDEWEIDSMKVFIDPRKIPYLEDEYDTYVTEQDVVQMNFGDVINGNKFIIKKIKID